MRKRLSKTPIIAFSAVDSGEINRYFFVPRFLIKKKEQQARFFNVEKGKSTIFNRER